MSKTYEDVLREREDPQARHIAMTLGLDAQGELYRLVAGYAVVPNLDVQGIKEHHGIHRFERPVLPSYRLGDHFVGAELMKSGETSVPYLSVRKP